MGKDDPPEGMLPGPGSPGHTPPSPPDPHDVPGELGGPALAPTDGGGALPTTPARTPREREFFAKLPAGSKPSGQVRADGKPYSYITPAGKEFYAPGSTNYENGFRTYAEYRESQGYGLTWGPHAGKNVPRGSYVLTTKAGRPILRVTKMELKKYAGQWAPITGFLHREQYKMPFRTYKGKEILLTPNQVAKFIEAKGLGQFKLAEKYRLIPKGSEFIPGKGIKWKFRTPAQIKQGKKIAEEKRKAKKVTRAGSLPSFRKSPAAKGLLVPPPGERQKTKRLLVPPPSERHKPKKISIPQKIWRALTPWTEEKNQTIISFITHSPQRLIAREAKPQPKLEAIWKAEQESPLWARILFGPSVIKDPQTGQLYELLYLEAPMLQKAAKPSPKQARQLVKTIEINYYKLLKPDVKKPQINWNEITKAIEAGKVKSAADATKWARRPSPGIPKKIRMTPEQARRQAELTKQGMSDAAAAAQKARVREWSPVQRFLTKARFQKLLGQYETMKPSQALKHALQYNLLLPVVASVPIDAYRMFTRLSGKDKAEMLRNLDPNIATPLEQGNTAKAGNAALTEIKRQTKLAAVVESAQEVAAKVETKVKTKTEIKEALATFTEGKVKTEGLAETATEVEELAATINEFALQTATITPMPIPSKPPTTTAPPKKLPIKPPVIPRRSRWTDKEKRQYIKKAGGAITWRQGMWRGKDRWDVIIHPYSDDSHYVMVLGGPPEGATIVKKGPGSAYGTAQVIRGKGPAKEVHVDSGFQDIIVTPSGKRVKLKYTPDPELETKGDITIGQGMPSISERSGALSERIPRISGRGTRISPKTPRLR